jgi:hypothetical protein
MPPTVHEAATANERFYDAVSKASFKSFTSLIAVLREGVRCPDPPVRFLGVGTSASMSLCVLLLIVMLVHVFAHAAAKDGTMADVPFPFYFIVIGVVGSVVIVFTIIGGAYIGGRVAVRILDQSMTHVEAERRRRRPSRRPPSKGKGATTNAA